MDDLPDGMTGQIHADLTARSERPNDAPDDLPYCAMCHGNVGRSGNPQIPRLDIQPQAYLEQTWLAYSDVPCVNVIMNVAATRISEVDPMELAI